MVIGRTDDKITVRFYFYLQTKQTDLQKKQNKIKDNKKKLENYLI